MASDYHPIYSSLWNDEKLEGAPFEEKGFFAFLSSNYRLRPSGIYRVTDAQLGADTTLPVGRVRGYCTDLDRRGLIIRDGAWLFVVSYFKRQPKGENLLKGVAADIALCSSARVLEAFAKRYPLHNRWVDDRRATLDRPMIGVGSTEQLQLQSRAEQSTVSGDAPDGAPLNGHGHGPAAMNTAARELLAFMNKKADRNFQPTPENLSFIVARLRGGATVAQCRAIIGRKAAEWKGDAKMHKFLRPETLFNATKFSSYQGELPASAFEPDPEEKP